MDYLFLAQSAKPVACEAVYLLTSSPFPDPLSALLPTAKPTYGISMGSNFYLSNSTHHWKGTFPQMGNDGIAHWDFRLLREPLCAFDWMLLLSEVFYSLARNPQKFRDLQEKDLHVFRLPIYIAFMRLFFLSHEGATVSKTSPYITG